MILQVVQEVWHWHLLSFWWSLRKLSIMSEGEGEPAYSEIKWWERGRERERAPDFLFVFNQHFSWELRVRTYLHDKGTKLFMEDLLPWSKHLAPGPTSSTEYQISTCDLAGPNQKYPNHSGDTFYSQFYTCWIKDAIWDVGKRTEPKVRGHAF